MYNVIAPHINYPEIVLEGYRNDGQTTNIKTQIINTVKTQTITAVKDLKPYSIEQIEVYIFQTGVQRELLQLGCKDIRDSLMTNFTNIW